MMSERRCLVVYHHLPHYRFAVFDELARTPGWSFTFAGAPTSRDGSIPVLTSAELPSVIDLANRWVGPFLWQRGLLSLARRRWDHVIFLGDSAFLSTWVATLLLRFRGIPVGYWTIGWHRPETGLRRMYRLAFYRLADRLYLYGDVGRQLGTEMGYPASKMGVIYNSSGGPRDRAETLTLGRPDLDQPVLCAVIRLNPGKRLDLLIDAAAIVRRRGRAVRVEIAGEGPERERLEARARDLDVPLVMHGAVYDSEQLAQIYRRSSVTVIPSLAGLSVTQSLRFGRPVITHDNMYEQVPECEAIIEGQTGSLYRYGDVESLADAIERWIVVQQEGWARTSAACHDEVRRRWTGQRQAQVLLREMERTRADRPTRWAQLVQPFLRRGRTR